MGWRFIRFLIFAMAAAGVAVFPGPAPAQEKTSFAIRNVRIFDGSRVIQNGTIVVQAGKISAVGGRNTKIPKDTQTIDGAGRTLIPGLIDAHVHLVDSGKDVGGTGLEQAITYGITTVLDLNTGNPADYKIFIKRVKDGEFPDGADLFTSGPGAIPPGGRGGQPVPSPDQAKAWVDEHKAGGASYIKLFLDDQTERGGNAPVITHETAAAVITAAHQDQLLTIAHTMQEKRSRELIDLGLDGMVHISPYEAFSPEFGKYVASKHVFQSSNMIGFAPPSYKTELAADPELSSALPPFMIDTLKNARPAAGASHEISVGNFKKLHAAHVLLLAGTDAFYPYPPLLHAEIEIMVKDGGIPPVEALAAATSNPAKAYHLTDRGRLAPGLRADMLLINGDPTTNILDTRKVAMVWREGREIDRNSLKAKLTKLTAPPGRGGGAAPGAAPQQPRSTQ